MHPKIRNQQDEQQNADDGNENGHVAVGFGEYRLFLGWPIRQFKRAGLFKFRPFNKAKHQFIIKK
jgi:hypothetical protein